MTMTRKILNYLRDMVSAFRVLPSQEARSYAYMKKLMLGHPAAWKTVEIQKVCARQGWACTSNPDHHVVLVRTPHGVLGQVSLGKDTTESYFKNQNIQMISFSKSGPSVVDFWERNLSLDVCLALWNTLPEGWTPLVQTGHTRHQMMADSATWQAAVQGLSGWSGEVVFLPPEITMTVDHVPLATGGHAAMPDHCMLAVRQGSTVALLGTTMVDVPGWTATEGAFPRFGVLGMHQVA